MFSESKGSQKQSTNFSNRVLINNTMCNKINLMAALRMGWYSLICINKPASREMLSECLMILDHLSREVGQ